MPTVNPEILRWARETAGLSPEQAVLALDLKDKNSQTAIQRLEALETGVKAPTRPQLIKMARRYRRPLLTFFMEAPPRRGERGEDFRSVPDRQKDADLRVDVLVRDIRGRQAAVRDLLESDEPPPKLAFIGSLSMQDGVEAVRASIQRTLGFDLAQFRKQSSSETAFTWLRARAEAAGIFVLLVGNLGSYHTAIDVEAFRGFALADSIAPFVVINDQDAPAAWSFTLLHELAHLWLGKTGVSGRTASIQIEKFCNDVAAALLLPPSEFAEVGVDLATPLDDATRMIGAFAESRNLSRSMVTYSLYRANLIDEATWRALSGLFLAQWRKSRASRREAQKDSSGPSYYIVRRHRLGSALLGIVARSLDDGVLTPSRASKVLGVKPRNVSTLLAPPSRPGGKAA